MKKRISTYIFCLVFLMISFHQAYSQAFAGKSSKYLTLGAGVSNYWQFGGYYDNYYYGYGYYGSRFGYFAPTVGFHVNAEFGIHDYIGIAPCLGVATTIYNSSNVSLDIPIGIQANFHFLQLIADKTHKNFADKLDVYVGVNTGGGPALGFYGNGVEAGGFFYVGPTVGVRYYVKERLGITAELGYGKTIANFGVVMKL